MKTLQFILLLFFLSYQTLLSQNKEIKGDTVYRYKYNKEFQNTLKLKDFEKSTDEFNFRFRNQGQVIEISKDGSKYNGNITNYIYHTKNANNKAITLSNKILLTSKQAENIYTIVQTSKILDLPSDMDIENWGQGFDGITYIIEHSDKKNYWFKNYWSPSSQDSIREALIVENLVKNLSDTLNLPEKYSTFKDDLPKKGCYNSGGTGQMCYVANSFEIGYSGATKLPIGFYTSYSATNIGKIKVNGSIVLQYNFDNDGFHHLNFQTSKWRIFKKDQNLSDYISYNYQNRKINVDDSKNKFENHQIKYGLNFKKNIGVGVGIDYLASENNKIGGQLFINKYFSNPKISAVLSTSIFENQVNYKAEIFKDIRFKNNFPVRRVSLGLAYESFMNYKDLYFKVLLPF